MNEAVDMPSLDQVSITRGYDIVARSVHWCVAVLVAAQFAIAWLMPDIHRNTKPEGLVSLHLSIGVLIWALMLFRLVWRARHPPPVFRTDPLWSRRTSHIVHLLLYVLLLVTPLFGWANAAARGWTVRVFGLFVLPPLSSLSHQTLRAIGHLHTTTSYVLLALVGIHVFAVLLHRFWLGNDVLTRMLLGQSALASDNATYAQERKA